MNKDIHKKYGIWRADEWLHYETKSGAGSILMTKEDISHFINMLASVLLLEPKLNSSVASSISDDVFGDGLGYSTDGFDEGHANIYIKSRNHIVIFLFAKEDFKDIINYLHNNA